MAWTAFCSSAIWEKKVGSLSSETEEEEVEEEAEEGSDAEENAEPSFEEVGLPGDTV